MFRWLRRDKAPAKPVPTRVVADAAGVSVFAAWDKLASFRWEQVAAVRAWKEDLWGYDCIWLGFELEGSTEPVCVHEELDGFALLIEEMQRECVGYKADWWKTVAFPAFAENGTLVWERKSSTG